MAPFSNRFTFAALPRTERGKPLVLGADPKGINFVYCHGNSVILRQVDHPEIADVYTQHSCPVLVAKYSPSGFYVASADKSGKIRIWDTVNAEHVLKNEYQPLSGPIYDLAWSPDNQRIVCVGEGREKFGHVFLADTGTSNGDITGQTRPVNTCDFKPSRPFRIVTGSEDNTAAVYEGPPFKFKSTKSEHSRYVQSVRYSPDGVFWVSAGFDGKIFLYDGKDSGLVAELVDGKNSHSGGVYAVAWSSDGKQLLSASGDRTCKLWDIETRRSVTTFAMGDAIADQQLGCIWIGRDKLLSVSLSGCINYLDPRASDKPKKVLMGHNKPITAMAVSLDGCHVVTGCSDGRIVDWNTADGESRCVRGEAHQTQVNGIAATTDDRMFASVGLDDTLRHLDRGDAQYSTTLPYTQLKSQPKDVSHANGVTAVASVLSIVLFKNGKNFAEQEVDYEPTSVALSKNAEQLAVGDAGPNHTVHIYDVCSATFSGFVPKTKLSLTGSVTDVAYSPDGKYLVVGDSNRKVTLFKTSDYQRNNVREWGFHTARVNKVSWSPNSKFVASGGLDCSLIIWSVDQPEKHLILNSAHVQSQITGVKWLDNTTVVTCGQDGNVKIWEVHWDHN